MPTAKDLKFSTLNFNKDCYYLGDIKEEQTEEAKQHILDLITYCRKIGPHVYFYKHQIKSLNKTAHHILINEVDLILLQFSINRKEKRGIFTLLITGFIGLADEGISIFCTIEDIKLYIKQLKLWKQEQIYSAINPYMTLWSCMKSQHREFLDLFTDLDIMILVM